MPELDVLIRGAGPVGCTLALALHRTGLRIGLLGQSSSSAFRPIVLSYASRLILERLDLWRSLEATPIETIQVSQAGGFGRTRFDAADCGVPALGYVLEYSRLMAAFAGPVDDLLVQQEGEARCVVHAEGSAADAAEKRYAQDAVVGIVSTDPPSAVTAHERFTPDGPLALLPLARRYAVVWSSTPSRAQALASAAEPVFLAELAAAAGSRIGRPRAVEARAVQPLALRVRATRVGKREVWIGNAAQTLHPVAGQGLNLGLRDAWDLARLWRAAADPGDAALLTRYAASRRLDAAATIRVTDALAGAFLGCGALARAARGAALTALDIFPAPRRFFARRMIFGASALP
jgi:2-octaprenyl-6-methoxyphenol hydroxylase